MKIKAFPASYGDSFLIQFEYEEKKYNILIDCGFKNTYTNYIKSELDSIEKLDLLVLTHIDDDHIKGAVELFTDYDVLKKLDIKNIWFNDLYQIIKDKYDIKMDLTTEKKDEGLSNGVFDEGVSFESAKTLSNYILESRYSTVWNKEIGLIQCNDKLYRELYPINRDIKFVLLSPNSNRIDQLLSEWCNEIKIEIDNIKIDNEYVNSFYDYFKNYDKFSNVFDEECSCKQVDFEKLSGKEFDDSSIANNSSIAFFIEIKDKRVLFLGDANAQDIKESLRKYIQDNNIDKIKFDLVKLSHHGSKNNITTDFFKIFYSDRYLVSSNGKRYNHPDIECLCKVIVKQSEFKSIIFNYNRSDISNEFDNQKIKKHYNYRLIMPKEVDDEQIITIDI